MDTKNQNQTSVESTLLTSTEVANMLHISKAHLYRLTSARLIPYLKPFGKTIYFDKSTLNNWIHRNPIKTNEELDQESKLILQNLDSHKTAH